MDFKSWLSQWNVCRVYVFLSCYLLAVSAVELTFELQDRDTQCFFEDIKKGEQSTVEFQVVTGGHYDIDCTITDPNHKELYKGVKKEYDSHQFTAEVDGPHQVCFGNEFSTFSHKLVYMDWYVGDEHPFRNPMKKDTVLTQLETSAEVIQNNLRDVEDALTHRRLREAQDRKFAEDLNESTNWWSVGQSLFMVFVGLGQIWVLRSFFTDKTRTHA
ncbi:transmembrane emp24 domain-containing protein 7-like [Paramacrobiotus metropolitanus]|uniref:transmembrane emp24 domain-containing protein 7-like n=1 Tax=Paramacrobiotus metropolitanus TaxID=2943436 RepID=UPI00244595CF|nr:transmembrane emp24 domain-containing protein 7-like [Paramacrobiotus metropolitanus]XP_055333836.1 transmembrane emp24 domain-containing protein 7-like [Paramacrobiotus metropolitanus]